MDITSILVLDWAVILSEPSVTDCHVKSSVSSSVFPRDDSLRNQKQLMRFKIRIHVFKGTYVANNKGNIGCSKEEAFFRQSKQERS